MKVWPLQDAKARFSELVEASVRDGPQIVTKRGVETSVVLSVEEWRRLNKSADGTTRRPSLKELLLTDPRRFELDIPPRGQWKMRTPIDFD